jgi:antitoxin (DNA-binding transcriptional repressor) of toxin-antitoxin stability system
MTVTMAIHEVKDHLSGVIATLIETGEEVAITKHGRVVARLVAAPPTGVVLGLGANSRDNAPSVEDLRWDDGAIADMLDSSAIPE